MTPVTEIPADAPKEGEVKLPPAAAQGTTKEEEVTDFDEEEKKVDKRIEKEICKVAQGQVNKEIGTPGFKLIVDLVLQHIVGQKQFSFFPNHTLVILMARVNDWISVELNIAPDPAYYEISFAVTPRFIVKVGKLLVPFGTNQFHHILGGRVDQQSRFLPETWGDFGVSVTHLLVDTKFLSIDYEAYVVNGFGGSTDPVIGVGTLTDNNFGKGLGLRLTATGPRGIRFVGSVYHSLWDVDNSKSVLFYAAGGIIPVGAIDLPVLKRMGFRGEWSRGELQYLTDNVQQGIFQYAVARAAWYAEITARIFDSVALRLRLGRVNPDNTVTDANDLEVYEPAIVIGSPKLAVILAWQFLKNPNKPYAPSSPGDVIYGKVFLQY